MDKVRVLIADDSTQACEELKAVMKKYENIELLGCVNSGPQALKIVQTSEVDVLVTDLILPVMDGFVLMEKLASVSHRPRVIVLTALMRDDFIQRAVDAGADYYMLKPFDPAVVTARVLNLASAAGQKTVAPLTVSSLVPCSLDERIANVFLAMGIPAHIKGYQFLREAIKTVVDNPEIINAITKELYPAVAKRYNTTASKVERAIRHAIDVAWSRGQVENLNTMFGSRIYVKTDKPTNGEFIALMADRLAIERAQEKAG